MAAAPSARFDRAISRLLSRYLLRYVLGNAPHERASLYRREGPLGSTVWRPWAASRSRGRRVAFALAHEVGHHLGGEPHHEFYTTISSEERASEWAEEIGLPMVFGEAVARRYVRRGVAQLAAVWKKYCKQHGRVRKKI